jgi:ABC-type sugar transport system ATPase subunit
MLEVQGLKKSFGGVKAIDNVSFSLQQGEAVGIMGDNGAGKSTLLKCLSGIIAPDEGNILFEKSQYPIGNPNAIRRLGIETVYQDLALCSQQTVLKNIFLGREMKNMFGFLDIHHMQLRANQILATINLHISCDAIVGNLSGGERQAVAIARALLTSPKFIIFDEPTSALGQQETQKVLGLMKNLTAKGIGILMISHRLDDIKEVTSRCLKMHQGKIRD